MQFKIYPTDALQARSKIEEMLERVKKIEENLSESIEPIRRHLEERYECNYVVRYGLEGFRERVVRLYSEKRAFNPQAWLFQVIQKNPELRFPHRKILEYLSRQYDYEKKEFREVNLSAIVRQCRLGKNRVHEYLRDLEGKGLLQRREDGYRVWYKITIDV